MAEDEQHELFCFSSRHQLADDGDGTAGIRDRHVHVAGHTCPLTDVTWS